MTSEAMGKAKTNRVAGGVTDRAVTTDAQIDVAIAQARVYEQYRPKAVAAAYRKPDDMIAIRFTTGVELSIPRKLLQGLESATAAELATVEIDDFGSALHWEKLDVDHYIPGLIDGVFGTRQWMAAIGKKGGAVRSDAKAAAVRENGRKGGRPRKGKAA